MLHLPSGVHGEKVGVDDYLTAGHSVDELITLVEREDPQVDEISAPYEATANGLVWNKPTRDGAVEVPLSNFTALITHDITEDDGAEQRRRFEICASLNQRTKTFTVPAAQFPQLGWATEHLGAAAIVYPGPSCREHARTAIQVLSRNYRAVCLRALRLAGTRRRARLPPRRRRHRPPRTGCNARGAAVRGVKADLAALSTGRSLRGRSDKLGPAEGSAADGDRARLCHRVPGAARRVAGGRPSGLRRLGARCIWRPQE